MSSPNVQDLAQAIYELQQQLQQRTDVATMLENQSRMMVQAIQANNATILANNAAGQPHAPLPNCKPRDPPIFNGTDHKYASTWIDNLEEQFPLRYITDDRMKIRFAAGNLSEAASRWWMNIRAHVNTWEDFKTAFKANYQAVDARDQATAIMLSIKQHSSVQVLNELWRQYRFQTDLNVFTDPICKEIYWNALKSHVRLYITKPNKDKMTLNELMVAAQEADREIYRMKKDESGKVSFTRNQYKSSQESPGSGHHGNYSNIRVKAELAAVDYDQEEPEEMSNASDEEETVNAVMSMPRPAKLTDADRKKFDELRARGITVCYACRQRGHYASKCQVKFTDSKK